MNTTCTLYLVPRTTEVATNFDAAGRPVFPRFATLNNGSDNVMRRWHNVHWIAESVVTAIAGVPNPVRCMVARDGARKFLKVTPELIDALAVGNDPADASSVVSAVRCEQIQALLSALRPVAVAL